MKRQISIPPEIASQVPRREGRRQFESAYAPDDSIYEQLIHDPSSR
jgi:hypothetical protein